ncbi:MAG: hypothetical protein NTV80_17455 [Verrucomicrobia bacterium]|nr:hypothetical protein [Verrucomicrobiota bacterium]
MRRTQSKMKPVTQRDWVFEVICMIIFVLLAIYTTHMIHHDSHVDSSTYSNRSLALPAGGFSFVITSYFAIRLDMISGMIRILLWPFAFFGGYLLIGLLLIFLNQVF